MTNIFNQLFFENSLKIKQHKLVAIWLHESNFEIIDIHFWTLYEIIFFWG